MEHSELKKKALERAEVRRIYHSIEPEFTLLGELLKARKEVGLTQAEVAKRMGTKAPAVTRLESSLGSGKHSPSIATLKKYANVLGYHLKIQLVPDKQKA